MRPKQPQPITAAMYPIRIAFFLPISCCFFPIMGDKTIIATWNILNVVIEITYASITPILVSDIFGCFSDLYGGKNVAMFE